MNPDMKTTYMEIVNNQGNIFNIHCLIQLKAKCGLTYADLVSLQPFIFLEIKEPSHIDR